MWFLPKTAKAAMQLHTLPLLAAAATLTAATLTVATGTEAPFSHGQKAEKQLTLLIYKNSPFMKKWFKWNC